MNILLGMDIILLLEFFLLLLCSIFTRGKIKVEEDKLTIVPLLRKKQEIKWHEIDAKIDYQHEKIYIGYEKFLLVLGNKKLLM